MKRVILSACMMFAIPIWAVPVEGHRILISAPTPIAAEVGREVAEEGGNVVDVAVAVGLTLSVTTPYFAALGGGGFAVVKMDGAAETLDFREVAPLGTGPQYYLKLHKDASINGGTAVGVPGFAAGLWALHKKYGHLPWKKLFVEPLRLATKGFAVSGEWTERTHNESARFTSGGKRDFLKKDGSFYKPGEVLKQPALAGALRLFRNRGPKGFYTGPVAQDLAASVRAAGGTLSLRDLSHYQVRWLKPLIAHYEGYTLDLMPPPSSGGVVIATALKLMDKLKLNSYPERSVDEYHLLAEIEKRAFRGRSLLADPDFHKNPLKFLLSDAYIKNLSDSVDLKTSTRLKPLSQKDIPPESHETTHFSILDAQGHAVSLTVTLNGTYGSGVVSNRYGIALNNEMDDFTTHPGEPNMFGLVQGLGNEVQPGKRPLSSMSPTVVEKNGKAVMSLGAPGGPRIISSVLQVLYRVLARHMDLDLAVQAPRVHHQFLPDILYVDKDRFSPEVLAGLRARGHKVEESWMAKVYVVRLRDDGILEGAFDARGEGGVDGI